jgi:hypothetical protein
MSASDSPPSADVRLLGARGPAATARPGTETPPLPESGLPAPVPGLRSPQPSAPWQHASLER